MIFAYLDEFGHIGPYFEQDHKNHNTSPVFGLAGILLRESSVRPFASYFLNRKVDLLGFDIRKSGKQAYEWEKKGTNLFTATSIIKYPEIQRSTSRLINYIDRFNGKIFYYGREKRRHSEEVNSTGLYKTVLSDAIRKIDSYCASINENFIIVMDQHSVRKELLETATKTMFGETRAYRLSSPPFEVESYLNQNIQAADWIATLVGRLWNYRLDPLGFSKYEIYDRLYWEKIHSCSSHSSVKIRRENDRLRLVKTEPVDAGYAIMHAQKTKITPTSIETISIDVVTKEHKEG